jgi:hypothetical protein
VKEEEEVVVDKVKLIKGILLYTLGISLFTVTTVGFKFCLERYQMSTTETYYYVSVISTAIFGFNVSR